MLNLISHPEGPLRITGLGGLCRHIAAEIQGAYALFLQVLGINFLHKAGNSIGPRRSVEGALAGTGQEQAVLGPGHGHVHQAPLLFQLPVFPGGAGMGENTLF